MIIGTSIVIVWALLLLAFAVPVFVKSRKLSAISLLLFALAAYASVEVTMSYPKPFRFELFPAQSYEVLHFIINPGKSLYLYVSDGSGTPRSYSFGWGERTEKLSNGLRVAAAKSRAQGGTVYYDPSLGGRGIELKYPVPTWGKTGGTR